jgi:hypothetical protein
LSDAQVQSLNLRSGQCVKLLPSRLKVFNRENGKKNLEIRVNHS